ncbi:hypothetical protein HELRODRAFT_168110 [Helobdella robusta]|uniref:Uncharacterized protein n=1 Tax=Helobdella robusta TaxID=6412 RepID=T1F064_HELRO|nr:hypothetical protein HELRODRAFT_168110 [Helobdella robusta]ESO10224.1 hypothetical protein HELRODRAFT_168110 [Helobdella robusta]
MSLNGNENLLLSVNGPSATTKVKPVSQKFENMPAERPFKHAVKHATKTDDLKRKDNVSTELYEESKKVVEQSLLLKTSDQKKKPIVQTKPALQNKPANLKKVENKPNDEINNQMQTIKAEPSSKNINIPNRKISETTHGTTTNANFTKSREKIPSNISNILPEFESETNVKNSFLHNQLAKAKISKQVDGENFQLIKHSDNSISQKLDKFSTVPKLFIPLNNENTKPTESKTKEKACVNRLESENGAKPPHCKTNESTSLFLAQKKNKPITMAPSLKVSLKNEIVEDNVFLDEARLSVKNEQIIKTSGDIIKTYKHLSTPINASKGPRKPARPPFVTLDSLDDDIKNQIKIPTKSFLSRSLKMETTLRKNKIGKIQEDNEKNNPSAQESRPISLFTEEEEMEEEKRAHLKKKSQSFKPSLPHQNTVCQSGSIVRGAAPPVPTNDKQTNMNSVEEIYDDVANNEEDVIEELYEELG